MRWIAVLGERRGVWWLAAGGLAIAGYALWQARSPRPQYITATVTRGDIQRTITTTGALNPVTTVQVGSYVSGTIKKLSCDFNTEVTVGQPCALVDPVPFQLIVDQDQAELGTAQAQLKKDEAALTYARVAYERDSKLLSEGTVSQDTVDSEKSAYDQALAQIGFDRASIVQKRAALKAAQVNLAYTNILSPVVGTVITRSIDVGQTVAASLQTPTLFIIGKDLTKMQVDTNVSEADVGGIRLGQDAYFSVQAFPGRTFRGKVTQIRRGPITVQNVVTYDVVIAFDNPGRLLFPGMTADTHVVTEEQHDVLRVPLPAIRFSPEGFALSREAQGREIRSEAAAENAPETPPGNSAAGIATEAPRKAGTRNAWQGGRESKAEGRGPEGGGRGFHQGSRRPKPGAEHRGRVWILANGKLKPVAVATGLDDGSFVEVSGEGLSAGDTVVVNQISTRDEKRGSTPLSPVLRQGGPRL